MIPQRGGLPHSDIHGSKPARGSPWLFAACHVLHRLLVPRHPPNALIALDTQIADLVRPATSLTMHRNHHPTNSPQDNIFKLHSKHSYSAHYTTPLNTAAPIDWTTLDATNRQHRDPFRSDRRQSPRRTSQTSPETQQCQVQDQPSCPTRPETHQNQIHKTKEHRRQTIRPGANTATDRNPSLSGARRRSPMEDLNPSRASQASDQASQPYGDYRIRTDDPLLAKQVLYQLS